MMPRLWRSFECGFFLPHENALHSRGATDMPPRSGAGLTPELVTDIHLTNILFPEKCGKINGL